MLSPIFFGNKYHVPPFFIIITDDAVFYWNGERISIKIGEQSQKRSVVVYYSSEELENLTGYVAAEANHNPDRKIQEALDALYDSLEALLDAYISLKN